MKVGVNGHLYFNMGEQLPLLSMYMPDLNDPLHFIPKFDKECTARNFTGKLTKCSLRFTFTWRCEKFHKNTSIAECELCNDPDKPRQGTAEKPIELGIAFTLKSSQF